MYNVVRHEYTQWSILIIPPHLYPPIETTPLVPNMAGQYGGGSWERYNEREVLEGRPKQIPVEGDYWGGNSSKGRPQEGRGNAVSQSESNGAKES